MRMESPSISINSLILRANLPSLPAVLIEISAVLENDASDANTVAKLLGADAALAARTLRLANSAIYRGAGEITDLKHAVIRVGPRMLWSLLMSTIVIQQFAGIDKQLMDMLEFWRHSLYVACISKSIAEAKGVDDEDQLYLSGLLHDIGKLVFLVAVPAEYGSILDISIHGVKLVDVEKERFGFTHAELGARILEHWNIPVRITDCILHHHDTKYKKPALAWIIASADALYHDVINNVTLADQGFDVEFDIVSILMSADDEYEKISSLINHA